MLDGWGKCRVDTTMKCESPSLTDIQIDSQKQILGPFDIRTVHTALILSRVSSLYGAQWLIEFLRSKSLAIVLREATWTAQHTGNDDASQSSEASKNHCSRYPYHRTSMPTTVEHLPDGEFIRGPFLQ